VGLSQPTVSRRVASLARAMGVELLRAGPRGLELTPAGERLRQRAERVDREVAAALASVDPLDERPTGAVRLTAPEGLGLTRVAPRLEAFRREHPGIDLVLVAESVLANLSRREADLALRFVPPRQRDLVMRRLASVPFAPYASPRYLHLHPRQPGDGIVAGDELVALHESLEGTPESAWLRRHARSLRVGVRVRTALALREALAAGAGVGLLPDYLGDTPGLRRLGTGPVLHRDLYLVYHRALRGVERVRIAARFVAACVERNPG
jgi:DNA-binding transcriptional LysR family regulator